MELRDVIRERRMVRNYTDEPVCAEAVERILDAGVRAPSAGFSQGQRFIVITDITIRASIATAARESDYLAKGFNAWLSKAPVHIVVCTQKRAYVDRYCEPDKSGIDSWRVPYWWVDAGASLMAILYSTVDEGYAAGFLGAHAFEGLPSLLGIPAEIDVIGVVTIGYPAPDRPSKSVSRGRIPREEMIRR